MPMPTTKKSQKPKKKDQPKPEFKWKKFERIVAAIHMAANRGAIVRWSKKIKGSQFDVAIRSKQGLNDCLTLAECKDYQCPIEAKEVEAFAIKSRRAKADIAVMISSSGHQRRCKKVAKGEKIVFYTLKTDTVYSPNFVTKEVSRMFFNSFKLLGRPR